MNKHGLRCGLLCGALAAAWLPTAAAEAVVAAQLRPAVLSRQASQSVMLGAAHAGSRVVAVGERGIILLSDDNGQRWQQAEVPVSVTLTAVRFADARNGVAVGHAGVVLTTSDGGAHWQRMLDGQRLAALALEAAKKSSDALALRDAERLVADGADKPLLDVCLLGAGRILAVGAYGIAFASEDNGRSWTPWMDRISNPKGLHLNTVRANGDTILLAGERGLALLSTDAGRSFRPLNVPYQGSFFTAELTSATDLLLAGLRGNAWRSVDAGRSWQQLASPMPVSITASTTRADGNVVLANQAGMLLTVRDQALVPTNTAPMPPLNAILALNNGGLLALSIQGIKAVAGAKQ
ncbi:YCF48-related protein [Duganella sp. BuS-21]|uniref:YCF48-related protein n=1 Tax=Duganella sp. BuS-21 TaxID=2943848 RepID=UPI0035A5DC82